MNIHIIVTGGTFDKEYNELNGELFFKNSHMPDALHPNVEGYREWAKAMEPKLTELLGK
jgi:lysophospholipase L1-like esterase